MEGYINPLEDNFMLEIKGLSVSYAEVNILEDLDLRFDHNKSIIIQGVNGCGKSTLLKAIYNMVPLESGSVFFEGEDIAGMSTFKLLQRGISYIPQENNAFGNLTVEENILIGNLKNIVSEEKKERLEYVFREFPALRAKRKKLGRYLSGGQRQLLALARVFLDRPKLILLDEPTLGLSEKNTCYFLDTLMKIKNKYKISLMIIEHNFEHILPIVDDIYLMEDKKLKIVENNKY